MPATVPEDKSHITVVETDSDSDSEVPPLVSSNTSVSSDSSLGYLRIPVVGHTALAPHRVQPVLSSQEVITVTVTESDTNSDE